MKQSDFLAELSVNVNVHDVMSLNLSKGISQDFVLIKTLRVYISGGICLPPTFQATCPKTLTL